MHFLTSVLLSFGLTVLFILVIRPVALRVGLVDIPGGRKIHQGHIPIVGGMAIFLGWSFASLTLSTSLQPYRALFAGCALLILVGVLDDFQEISPKARLLVQLIVSMLMVYWGKVVLATFGDFFLAKSLHLGYFGVILTVLAVIGLINGKNMLDGLDGLAAGVSVIELLFLISVALHGHRPFEIQLMWLLVAALLGFLCFNFPFKNSNRRVFMGDAGSTFLGFFLTWFCVSLSQGGMVAANPATFVWIMGVPLMDFVGVFTLRLLQKRSPLKADRSHMHYRLLDAGYSPLEVNCILYAMAIGLGSLGVFFSYAHVVGKFSLLFFLGLFALYLWWMLRRHHESREY